MQYLLMIYADENGWNALTPEQQQQGAAAYRAYTEALQKSGVSVVLTTHHLEEAEQRCQRILIIDHGRIVASGTLDELVQSSLGHRRSDCRDHTGS